jgi:V/A-type H+-transporting ATPase subunit I
MIVRMSKVEIVGRKILLLGVLSVIRKLGIFQIEHGYRGFFEDGREAYIAEPAPDEQVIAERLTVENLGAKIDELTACLPKVPVRESYLSPQAVISSVAVTIEKHCAFCKELSQKRETLRKELAELDRHTMFIETLEALIAGAAVTDNLDFIGITLKHP